MTRRWYRLALSAVCSLAACAGPVLFLEDRARIDYLLGGFAAALLTWGLLTFAILMEPSLPPGLLAIMGAGAGVLSWFPISLVMAFEILPHLTTEGWDPFDPVWLLAGFSPLVVLAVAWWRSRQGATSAWGALTSTLYRFSVPLFALQLLVMHVLGLTKQFRWLFLFTGIMFLVLDALGTGDELPLTVARQAREQEDA